MVLSHQISGQAPRVVRQPVARVNSSTGGVAAVIALRRWKGRL